MSTVSGLDVKAVLRILNPYGFASVYVIALASLGERSAWSGTLSPSLSKLTKFGTPSPLVSVQRAEFVTVFSTHSSPS